MKPPARLNGMAIHDPRAALRCVRLAWTLPGWALLVSPVPPVEAQTSSLGKRPERVVATGRAAPHAALPRESQAGYQGNTVLEQNSLFGIEIQPPKEFKVHDILTIIVRHQKKFEADAELENKKDFEIKSELDAFFKPTAGGLGAATFHRGKPNVDYSFGSRVKGEGDSKREDSFVTRISGTIVDVKPNGNLVIEATSRFRHEDEVAVVTLTGMCRGSDVTPDNTVLSTQVADLDIKVSNSGGVRDAATRGWITRLLDALKPF